MTQLINDRLEFHGVITAGIGKHSELGVPGRSALISVSPDWPDRLYPGSLNVRVETYPKALVQHGLADRIAELDRGLFRPAFQIARDLFRNNHLRPRPGVPNGGDAQVWRARIEVVGSELTLDCWALRRFGSRVGEQLEFVAADKLRDLGLENGQKVVAILFGSWHI